MAKKAVLIVRLILEKQFSLLIVDEEDDSQFCKYPYHCSQESFEVMNKTIF